jgi:hypothetical protein
VSGQGAFPGDGWPCCVYPCAGGGWTHIRVGGGCTCTCAQRALPAFTALGCMHMVCCCFLLCMCKCMMHTSARISHSCCCSYLLSPVHSSLLFELVSCADWFPTSSVLVQPGHVVTPLWCGPPM